MGKKSKSKPKRAIVTSFGKKLENKMNQQVKEWVESAESVEQMNAMLESHVQSLKKVRGYSELISQQLNIPSKDDVARVANLVIQVEEKIDRLEEKVDRLGEETKTLKKKSEGVSQREKTNKRNDSRQTVINNNHAASPMLMVNPHITDPRLFQNELECMLDEEWE
ncbi:hypothetical protein M3689_15530 [Alkalihalophilus marmarensis]|jgi:DNA repair exonuclease SbcCD ATPase subunit|uniref:Polyhydroxyalkanoic acid synthase, PhaR subunit n=1 Tax=Alkalihalophilus marmarensis DSM 21297 TaxID=1188261 RepID=U6SL45_9BACI|nr:hypothetical protein [Alkalihalophilus marmarensis]ERN51650.1 hypothetical protein A33I_19680 [Alkalihalophilus marmarensis DSM 21297]MCM3490725.1 hypothetical protein [Alkalihalophilus marmarensis]